SPSVTPRHREQKSPLTAHECTHRFGLCQHPPADMIACDHGDGRSPGLRVVTLRRPPGNSQWHTEGVFTAHSCGGSYGLRTHTDVPSPHSLLIPNGNRHVNVIGTGRALSTLRALFALQSNTEWPLRYTLKNFLRFDLTRRE